MLALSPRGFHKGILHYEYNKQKVFVIDKRTGWHSLPEEHRLLFQDDSVVINGKIGQSCKSVCNEYSKEIGAKTQYLCNNNQLQFINSCYYLEKIFPCENGCWNEVGQDLPAYSHSNKLCLFSSEVQPLCNFAMKNTQRVCLCTNEKKVEWKKTIHTKKLKI